VRGPLGDLPGAAPVGDGFHTWCDWGNVRRVTIRVKLLGALAAPLLCLLAVIVVQVGETSREVDEQRIQSDLATAVIGPTGLMSALQRERSWAVVDLVGQGELVTLEVTGYEETRADTDAAVADFRNEVENRGGDVAAAYQQAIEGLGDLTALRADIDANTSERALTNNVFADTIFRRYAGLVAGFHDGNSRLALTVDDPKLRQGAEVIDLVSRQTESSAELLRAMIQSGLPPDPSMSRSEITNIAGLADTYRRQAAAIVSVATGPYRAAVEPRISAGIDERLLETAERAAVDNEVDVGYALGIADIPRDQALTGINDHVADELHEVADDLADSARRRVQLFRALAVLAILVAVLATWIVSRSITKPLHSLTAQATDMANARLPSAVLHVLDTPLGDDVVVPHVHPVAVGTRDEVADVAAAINTVQDSALGLAVEQAVLRRNIADSFVNLGRRNQNLLGRQLDFITELEVNETDPEVLSNLFKLDHLATRMRRNAESLLLLAGVEPPRKWAAPVRITDAIRAALGEVEDYPRVVDRGVEPATVIGSAAADVAHLLAELIDNALIYSPPDQAVEVRGRFRPDGYTLAIIDAGLGMLPEELQRANRRLAGAESFTIAPSKYLGHYVAGNLAARHNIHVALHNSPGHGITATVTLPPNLLSMEPVATAHRHALT
jgi:signal transduction histidine kinase